MALQTIALNEDLGSFDVRGAIKRAAGSSRQECYHSSPGMETAQ